MDITNNNQELISLIKHVSLSADGVGDSTASTIATYFDSLDSFLSATEDDLRGIKNIKRQPILRQSQSESLMKAIQKLPRDKGLRETWVSVIVSDFVDSAVENLNSIHFDNLMLNPLLVRALDMRTANQVLEFFLYQSISRSVVTSWGMRVQDILIHSGADPIVKGDPGGFDVKKVINNVFNFIQIKSGTNTMNVDMIRYLNQKVEELESEHPNHKGLLGLTYGRRNQVSGQIMGNLNNPQERLKVGEELWEFISSEKGYFFKVLEIIAEASHKRLEKSFADMIQEKFDEIKVEWQKRYGGFDETSVDQFLSDYLGISKQEVEELGEKAKE